MKCCVFCFMIEFMIFLEISIELLFSESSQLGIPAFHYSKTFKMNPHKTMKIPIFGEYRMVLVFPSSPSPHPSAPSNLEVSFLIIENHFTLVCYQGGGSLTLGTNEKKPLKHSGDYLLAPFLPQHDYLLVPCDTTQMIYYEQNPECLQDYKFLGILKQPEVN